MAWHGMEEVAMESRNENKYSYEQIGLTNIQHIYSADNTHAIKGEEK